MTCGREQMEKVGQHTTSGFNDWEQHSPPPPSLVQPPPLPLSRTIPTLSHITDGDFLSVFPPINHEGLPVYTSPPVSHPNHQDLSSSALETSPSPQNSSLLDFSDSSNRHRSHSRLPSNLPLTRRSSLSLRTITSELLSLFFSLPTRVLPLKSQCCSPGCGGTITAALLMAFGMWKWWQRRRRRTGVGAPRTDSVDQLNFLIRQKDEKITELLNQIAQLNRILIARYKVPLVNSTVTNG